MSEHQSDDAWGCLLPFLMLGFAILCSLAFRGLMHLLGIEEPPGGFGWEP